MEKRFLFVIFFILTCFNSYSQQTNSKTGYVKDNEVFIESAKVIREKTTFRVTYKVSFGKNVQSCNIKLYESYDGGKTFHVVNNSYISGDGRVFSPGEKTIIYDFSPLKNALADKKLQYEVRVVNKVVLENNLFLLANTSIYPLLSYGVFAGYVKKFGGYIRAVSNFSFPKYSYAIDKNGNILDRDGKFWASDSFNVKHSYINVSVGGIVRATYFLFPYVGLGVGSMSTYGMDVNKEWALVDTDTFSYTSVSVDAGFVVKIGKISALAGISHIIGHEFLTAEVGVGLVL